MFFSLPPAFENQIVWWQMLKILVCHICVLFTLFVTVHFTGLLFNEHNQYDLNMYIP